MTNGLFGDDFVIKAPALDASKNPALRGVTLGEDLSDKKAGVEGVNYATQGLGLLGGRDKIFQQNVGVYGQSNQQGVFGHSTADSGTGVFGNSVGSGFGVRGDSTDGIAVQGQSFGNGIAVQGVGGRLAGRFEGNVEVTGNIDVIGDIRLVNADCAEDFDILDPETVQPGTVMVIESGGALRQSSRAYDKRVAGVVSGAGNYKPGLVLDSRQSSEGRMPIALMGKVYCKVDAQYGEIEIGDLLTSSPTPGCAMKAADPSQAFGAILGKALSPLMEGQALIPILVSLQ
ncbi:hypothetical protein MICAE_870002 [Microcystis aeruginosa PCC 9806]|uniref:Uncharacterized protein n=2 Tax=Microcystis TaxID=1125 RepID=A0A552LZK3_9CHRO|nr:hypothetical protein [Microcystis aeruginosa]TRV25650.1 MAG: hypothetical protein EWV40_04515 [Microcystis flos-aquae Mf_WU_F_19750830_S460]CCI16435.1 hypothetical protein MICAE_870002 [Microcystis aeruginosa PCC 9806]